MSEKKIVQLNVTLLKPVTELYSINIATIKNETDEYCSQLSPCEKYNDKVFIIIKRYAKSFIN